MTWFRVAVEFDPAGNAISSSYEAHNDDGELVALHHAGAGPFDDPLDLFTQRLRQVRNQFGVQVMLF